MQTDATLEQVKILAKQLKVPTFAQYPDLIRHMSGNYYVLKSYYIISVKLNINC